jgi:hypothetical protein
LVWKVSVMILFGTSAAMAQLSGYLSSLQGFNTNPLYNYAEQSDQLNQTYLELNWTTAENLSRTRVGYIGSLMLFNQIRERTYYEHFVVGEYVRAFPRGKPVADSAEPPPLEARHANILSFQGKVGSRHDRKEFEEYDNVSVAGVVSYKIMPTGGGFITLSNELGYRGYPHVSELSNVLDLLTVKGGGRIGGAVSGALSVQAGMKHFTKSVIDSSLIEEGNNGAIVVSPSSANAFILGVGGEIVTAWNSGSLTAAGVVRFNLTDSARYVTQFANTLGLNEDLYNDFFSYEGPEFQLTLKQTLPLSISMTLSGEYAVRTYFAPAFDLAGNAIEPNRIDRRFSAELYASRYFELGGIVGLDVVLSGTLVSSQSNDEYNDYTVRSIALGVGFGF